jgi:hypothetical protein
MSAKTDDSDSNVLTPEWPADEAGIREHFERTTALGHPTCRDCWETPREERADGTEFWPKPTVYYLDCYERGGRGKVDYHLTRRCLAHDEGAPTPDHATHRVLVSATYEGDDPDRGNSDYSLAVEEVEDLRD